MSPSLCFYIRSQMVKALYQIVSSVFRFDCWNHPEQEWLIQDGNRKKKNFLLPFLPQCCMVTFHSTGTFPFLSGAGDVFVALLFYMQWMYLFLGLFFNVPLFKVDIIWSWQQWLFKLCYFPEYFRLHSA